MYYLRFVWEGKLNNISFIVPVYNGEKYVSRCIDSILKCNFVNFEIIVIDDGSIDHTARICKKYADCYSEVKYISQENRGVSEARNLGLKIAKKEYITFIDADDYIDNMHVCQNEFEKADITIYNFFVFKDNVKALVPICDINNWKIGYKDIIRKYILTDSINIVWAKIFRREFIIDNNIEFPIEMKIGEDAVFMGQCLSRTKDINYVNSAFYVYYKHKDSASSKAVSDFNDQERLFSFKKSMLERADLLEKDRFYQKSIGDIFSSLRSQTSNFAEFKLLLNNLNKHLELISLLNSDIPNLGVRRLFQKWLLLNKHYRILYSELKIENWRISYK